LPEGAPVSVTADEHEHEHEHEHKPEAPLSETLAPIMQGLGDRQGNVLGIGEAITSPDDRDVDRLREDRDEATRLAREIDEVA